MPDEAAQVGADTREHSMPTTRMRPGCRIAIGLGVVGWLWMATVGPSAEPTAVAVQFVAADSLDRILDLYVRDGLVYYAALRSERTGLDRYLRVIADPPPPGFGSWPGAERKAFLLNAYNALVLRTVIDHYPIRGVLRTTRSIASARFRAPSVVGRTAWQDVRSHWTRSRATSCPHSPTRGCSWRLVGGRSAAVVCEARLIGRLGSMLNSRRWLESLPPPLDM